MQAGMRAIQGKRVDAAIVWTGEKKRDSKGKGTKKNAAAGKCHDVCARRSLVRHSKMHKEKERVDTCAKAKEREKKKKRDRREE